MSNIEPAERASASPTRLTTWIRRHPLIAFFAMAYGFAWLLWIPFLVLSKNGIGWLPFRAPTLLLVIVGGFSPAAASIIVHGVLGGKAAVKQLLRRCIQWRVGVQWYVLSIFLVPILYIAASALLGKMPAGAALQSWTLLLTFYPLALIIQVLVAGGLGEEPGWRGLALPMMQSRYGALPASLLLGALHACWHIPLFFVPELSQAHFSFLLYLLIGMCISVVMTWVYNNTAGSLLLMMLLHEAQDTTSALSLRIAPQLLERTPVYLAVYGLIAIAVLLFTRGRLSYRGEERMAESREAGTASL